MNQLPIPLALPDFIYTEPTLASGGGAEVVSLANRSWFTKNGFSLESIASLPPYSPLTHQFSLSPSTPFGFDSSSQDDNSHSTTPPDLSILRRAIPPSLPIYSASGFDLLGILARVATRPNPHVVLGSVDLKCAFVVVDTRRFDHPIVYCSPSFCTLTGYPEDEIIGRNCRFLQAPAGHVRKGDPRNHTSPDAVAHLRKSLVANKECQTTIRNFRKDGSAFMNLLTVIPLSGGVLGSPDEEDDYVFHVGFQVDLAQKPNAILDRLNHGSYLVNYSPSPSPPTKDRKSNSLPPVVMSRDLRNLIADPAFIKSIPLSTSTTIYSSSSHDEPFSAAMNHPLHMLLLEASPDFIHVVSLKGNFLYVAPSVRRVLGYEPEHMVGKAISDFAHPKDVVPLMRELKESSAVGNGPSTTTTEDRPSSSPSSSSPSPRTVNILFRARTNLGKYVWIESRGRLHVEPGKGRKAIVLSGRARHMCTLSCEDLNSAGGLARSFLHVPAHKDKTYAPAPAESPRAQVEQDVWGMISGHRKETMTFLSVGKGVEDVLGWTADELVGRNVMDLVLDEGARSSLGNVVAGMKTYSDRPGPPSSVVVDGSTVQIVRCALRRKGSGVADVLFVLYQNQGLPESASSTVPLVYQIRLARAQTILPEPASKPVSVRRDGPSRLSFSSLAGAVPILNFSAPAVSLPPLASQPTAVSDMFEELAVSKGSSWQYELQQLRFANVRLREELAGLTLALGGGDASAGVATAAAAVGDDDEIVVDDARKEEFVLDVEVLPPAAAAAAARFSSSSSYPGDEMRRVHHRSTQRQHQEPLYADMLGGHERYRHSVSADQQQQTSLNGCYFDYSSMTSSFSHLQPPSPHDQRHQTGQYHSNQKRLRR